MVIVLSCDVPIDRWKDSLVQRGRVETARPLDRPRYAPIRAKCGDGFGEAYEVAKPGVRSETQEDVDVVGQDCASQHGRRRASRRATHRDHHITCGSSIHAPDPFPGVPCDVGIKLVRVMTRHALTRLRLTPGESPGIIQYPG
jgi:hypothetical protein